jgi:hypothetical protein
MKGEPKQPHHDVKTTYSVRIRPAPLASPPLIIASNLMKCASVRLVPVLFQVLLQLPRFSMTDLYRPNGICVCFLQFDGSISDILACNYDVERHNRGQKVRFTIHFLPSLQEIFWIRESDKTVLGL